MKNLLFYNENTNDSETINYRIKNTIYNNENINNNNHDNNYKKVNV